MADEEVPQAPPATQGAQDPLTPQNPPTPQNPQIPPVPQVSHAPQTLQVLQQPIPHEPLLNWCHFKSKFSWKPDEDTKLIYFGQMIGWTHMDFRTMSKYEDSA